MFGSLIRRKELRLPNAEDGTFEFDDVSLEHRRPAPAERRADDRLAPTLRVAKLSGPSAASNSSGSATCPPAG